MLRRTRINDTATLQLESLVMTYRRLPLPSNGLRLHRACLQQIVSILSSKGVLCEDSSTWIWQDIIFPTLERLKNNAKEQQLPFLLLAYAMMKDLWMRLPVSQRIWVDSMRSLIAYRLSIDDAGQDCNIWSLEARSWFNVSAQSNATASRDLLRDFSDFVRRCTTDFHLLTSGTELFTTILQWTDDTSFVAVFLRVHVVVFSNEPVEQSELLLPLTKSNLLETYVRCVDTAFQMDGVYIATINIAALLKYGRIQDRTDLSASTSDHTVRVSVRCLFSKIITMILRTGSPNIFPFIYVTLNFLWTLAITGDSPRLVEDLIPWNDISSSVEQMSQNRDLEVPLYGEGLTVLPDDSITYDQFELDRKGQEECFQDIAMISRRIARIRWLWENLLSLRSRE